MVAEAPSDVPFAPPILSPAYVSGSQLPEEEGEMDGDHGYGPEGEGSKGPVNSTSKGKVTREN